MEPSFSNGEKVRYAYGLEFYFVGVNPLNNSEAFVIKENGDTSKLPIERLTKVSDEKSPRPRQEILKEILKRTPSF